MQPHHPFDKANVGGNVFCRLGSIATYKDLQPPWRNLGTLSTEGFEAENPEEDIPESWGWTLPDQTLLSAALQAPQPEWV